MSATFFVYEPTCQRSTRVQSLSRYSTSHLVDNFWESRTRSARLLIQLKGGWAAEVIRGCAHFWICFAALKAGKQFENELDQLMLSQITDFTPVVLEKLKNACREALRFKQMRGVV